jgi:hypothetical protein
MLDSALFVRAPRGPSLAPRTFASLLLLLAALAPPARAADSGVMTYRYNAPESALDQRYLYHWKILRTALERTTAEYGAFEMLPAPPMTEARQAFELENATGKLSVMYLGTKPEFERELVGIHIPIDKNLGGYCVFLIREERQAEFDRIQSLTELRNLRFGLGFGWLDADILRGNAFQVVTGSSYDGLFEMLLNDRFDLFLRSATEVLDEYQQRAAAMPDLHIEDHLLLYYPMPMYFWFARNDEGRRLASRAERGMRSMIEDGTFDRLFSDYQDRKIERLDLQHRRTFKIPNPLLGPETPFAEERLWFDPATYRRPSMGPHP